MDPGHFRDTSGTLGGSPGHEKKKVTKTKDEFYQRIWRFGGFPGSLAGTLSGTLPGQLKNKTKIIIKKYRLIQGGN